MRPGRMEDFALITEFRRRRIRMAGLLRAATLALAALMISVAIGVGWGIGWALGFW